MITLGGVGLFFCVCVCGGTWDEGIEVKKDCLKCQVCYFCGEKCEFVVGARGIYELV